MRIYPLFFILIILALTGCSLNYYIHPEPTAEMEGFAIPMLPPQKVTLINTQSYNDNIIIVKRAGHVGYANPKEFTDVAIAITSRELKKRGIKVIPNAQKTLKMSIDYIASDLVWNIESKVVMGVETGDGFTAKFTGIDSRTSWGVRTALSQYDTVLVRAVGEMLSDKKIIEYLSVDKNK